MSLDNNLLRKLLNAVASNAAQTAWCKSTSTHEPKSAPDDYHFAVVMTQATPHTSGLISTTFRLEMACRVYVEFLREPKDDIDGDLMEAVWDLMQSYSNGFTLGGLIREVDLLGEAGEPLQFKVGYVSIDKRIYRVADITLPVIVNDLFSQGA